MAQPTLQLAFPAFLRLLNEHGVDFLVVGRRAAAFHDYAGFEQDTDLVVLPRADNVRRLTRCLAVFGFGDLGVDARDFTGNATVTLARAPRRLDLTTYIGGVELAAAWARRRPGTLASVPVHFFDKEDFLGTSPTWGARKTGYA